MLFGIPPYSTKEQTEKMLFSWDRLALKICRGFKLHDLITYESKVQARGVSFVRFLQGICEFSPTDVTRSPPIEKRI